MSPRVSSLNLVLLGPPGSGKSTQAALLAERYRIPHISTGEMLRLEVERGTARGFEVAAAVNKGELVSNGVVSGLVLQRLDADDCARGFVLEGFPRSAEQAVLLDDVLAELGRGVERVFLLGVNDEEIVARNAGRRVHPASGRTYHVDFDPPLSVGVDDFTGEPLVQREDDREEAVRERLRVYHLEAPPLIDFYRNRSQLVVVDGGRGVDAVGEALREAIETPVGA